MTTTKLRVVEWDGAGYALVYVIREQRCVEKERYPLAREEEEQGEERVRDVLGKDELAADPLLAAFEREHEDRAHLVELITEVYGVDVITLEVGEHDDLCVGSTGMSGAQATDHRREKRTKKTMVNKSPAAMRTEKRKSHPGCPDERRHAHTNRDPTASLRCPTTTSVALFCRV